MGNRKALHLHLRNHKITVSDYYHKHYPRYDLFQNSELIEFRDYDQYFGSFFNSKDTFSLFCNQATKPQWRDFIEQALKTRKSVKGIESAPCQVELKTTPNMFSISNYYNSLDKNVECYGFYDYCRTLGLKSRFVDNRNYFSFNEDLITDAKVIVDTREQKPFRFNNISVKKQKLDYGDYCVYNDNGYQVFFERKSLTDLISTVTMGEERFRKEIERAEEEEQYLVILVESSIPNLLNFANLKWVYSNHRITSQFVCHNIRQLIRDYSNIQFLFTKTRKDAVSAMSKIYGTVGKYKETDLQYMFDLGKFY